ncbi:MAG TPA: serine/threonine-protein kinase, partial [Polyangiaceae bacterium]|nr:serine/threonine-protein kinase [Polyangiaceae bacterium]
MKWRAKAKVGRCGRVIAGRYRLEAPLGSGGMGTIWSAEHTGLRSRVAIKFLDAAIADDPEMLERFLREAQSAAAVRGSHVVQIFDCGVDGRDPYIAMELLEGETLDERLTARVRLTPVELNQIFNQVATAVGNAHHLGVIHRDLKPPNIFLAREGELEVAKVLDFGIAKLMNRDLQLAAGTGTRTGTLLGTPSYMSPEQARGSRSLDQATDLWSLAVIAFECLTGQLPFAGKTLGDLVVQICTEQPAIPSEVARVPGGFDDWFLKGVSKDPADRFGTAREMAEALQEILSRADTPAVNLGSESPSEPTLHSVAPLPTRVLCPASLAPAQLAGAAETGPRTRLSSQFSVGWASPALQRLRASAALLWLRRVSPWAAPLALLGAVSMVALWLGAASRERDRSSQQPAPDPVNAVLGALPPPQRGSELPPPALEGEPGAAASVPSAVPLRRAADGVG